MLFPSVQVGPHADAQSATNARHDLEAKGFKSDDAHERRKIVNNRTRNAARIAVFGLLLGWFCAGCNKSVVVPSDCQRFLDQFFQALKSNDVGKLQELSFPETVMDLSGVPQEVADRMRDDRRQMDKTQLEKMKQMFGDFENYSVESVKVNSVTAADLEAVKMQGAKDFLEGTHAVIICKAKFSKASGRFGFDLIKKSPESEYLYEAYRFEEQL
jgi:hypothetical protein